MQRRSERRRQFFSSAAALGALAVGFSTRAAPAGRDTIRLGQSVPLSGPAQELGIEYQRGLRLAFELANTEGGVGGRAIELISYDDRYEPETALANTRDLQLRTAGSTPPEYVSLEGWIAGMATVQALRRMPRNGGRDALMAALESLGGVDLGGFPLRWDAARRQASNQVGLTVLDATGRPRR